MKGPRVSHFFATCLADGLGFRLSCSCTAAEASIQSKIPTLLFSLPFYDLLRLFLTLLVFACLWLIAMCLNLKYAYPTLLCSFLLPICHDSLSTLLCLRASGLSVHLRFACISHWSRTPRTSGPICSRVLQERADPEGV